ncbi:MAG: hypothetical protein HKN58_00665 [Xanthomonadales bacterium]|nr:hypothetical protein [Xanthomonadales bacterium]
MKIGSDPGLLERETPGNQKNRGMCAEIVARCAEKSSWAAQFFFSIGQEQLS